MLRPYPNDPRLTGIAIAYQNRELIADQVMPRVEVGKTTFKWLEYDFAQGVTVPETAVGRKGRPTEVEFNAEEVIGGTQDYALDDVVPNDDIVDAPEGSGIDPLGQATEGLTNLILLAREVRVATAAQATGNFTHTSGLTSTARWDDYASGVSDPGKDVLDAINTPMVRPNIAITSLGVLNVLRRHPKIVAALSGSGTKEGMVSRQALIDFFELDDLLVGAGWVNTAKPGQTPVYARVWGKSFTLVRRAPIVAARGEPSWGFSAQFGTRVSKKIDEPKLGLRGAQRVRVGESIGEIIQSKEAGYLYTTVIG